MRLCRGHSFQAGAFALSFIFLCKCVNTLRQVLSEAKKKLLSACPSFFSLWPTARTGRMELAYVVSQDLYFCTSKASKLKVLLSLRTARIGRMEYRSGKPQKNKKIDI